MSESNDTTSSMVRFNATVLLIFWLLVIGTGIIFFILAIVFGKISLIWTILLANPIALVSYIFMLFPVGNVFIAVRNLIEKREWVEPMKFYIGVVTQLGIATATTILTMFFFGMKNFTNNVISEFFILVPLFTGLFSVVFFLIFGLYSYFNEG